MEYIQPRVAIDESDVGTRPTQAVSLSAIGLVGTFSKGPVNQAVTIGSLEQLVTTFGGYTEGLTGYLSALAALNQGASDLKIVRIGGTAMKAAEKIYKDASAADSIKVTAASPGTWGNDIKVAVAAGTAASTFKLVVIYGSQSETLDNLTLENLNNVNSQFVTVSKVTEATNLPQNIASTPLAGGNDGAAAADGDYIGTLDENGKRSGLKVLETVQVGLVLCAQQHSATVQNALLTHCAGASIGQGLRVAILNPVQNLSVDAAAATTASMDAARGILTYPWVEPVELPGQYVAPDGYYAGLLSVLRSNQSPSNKQIQGILSAERMLSEAEVKTLTLARISPISLVPGRGFRVRNGVNLASDSAWSQTCIRRASDQLEMEVFAAIQWAISEENTPELRTAVAAQLDALMLVKKLNREIYDYKPTLCDDSNNTSETIAARILNVAVRPRFTYPADYVDVYIQRQIGSAS
ncbi:phage tail sheath N-terminal beta-sandwich domain-containing protein [Desulforamulus ruminis]|nr:phage tail sheath subtilisin-like domain-containing protein [Desulforamulus ruminis]